VHAFLVDDSDGLTLVDTLFESDARLVLAAIRGLGRKPSDLKRIAITHGHRSHLGGLAALTRASGATVYAHEWEADIVAGNRRAQPVSILPRQSLKLLPFQLGLWLGRPRHVPCPVDELLDDGDGLGPLQVLHAAGHSPGHLAFAWPERKFLIAGDAVATWPELCPGWHAFKPEQATAPNDTAASGRPRPRHRRRRPRRPAHPESRRHTPRACEPSSAVSRLRLVGIVPAPAASTAPRVQTHNFTRMRLQPGLEEQRKLGCSEVRADRTELIDIEFVGSEPVDRTVVVL
jgi:glyoxylase-like metal-dependent hydrolase (beta-lactamase superfamily II)